MKRHVQEPGIRRWFGQDLIELQSEPIKVLDYLLADFSSCAISGCMVTGTTEKSISPGLIHFKWLEGSDVKSIVVPFDGFTGLPSVFTRYIVLSETSVNRTYEDGAVKSIASNKKAILSSTIPANGIYLTIDGSNNILRLRDVMQNENYRFVNDIEKDEWSNKLASSEVVTTPTANKVLRLNASAKFTPGAIATDASNRFVTDTEKNTWNNQKTRVDQILELKTDTDFLIAPYAQSQSGSPTPTVFANSFFHVWFLGNIIISPADLNSTIQNLTFAQLGEDYWPTYPVYLSTFVKSYNGGDFIPCILNINQGGQMSLEAQTGNFIQGEPYILNLTGISYVYNTFVL